MRWSGKDQSPEWKIAWRRALRESCLSILRREHRVPNWLESGRRRFVREAVTVEMAGTKTYKTCLDNSSMECYHMFHVSCSLRVIHF